MADYQILYWDTIPFGVRAYEDTPALAGGAREKRVSKQLPMKFNKVIGVLSMVSGKTSQKDYQNGFVWGPRESREGSAEQVAQQVYDELIAAYPPKRLVEIVRQAKQDKNAK